MGGTLLKIAVGITTFLLVGAVFLMLSRIMRKPLQFITLLASWGLSYVPTFICVAAVWALSFFSPYLSPLAGFLVNTFFIMLLVWKTILYFLFMRQVLDVSQAQLVWGTAVIGVILFLLMAASFSVGLQVPLL